MKKLFLSLVALASVLTAGAYGQWTVGDTPFTADTLYHSTTGPGITSTGLRMSWQENKSSYTTNVHYSTIDLNNPALELRGVQAQDNGDLKENVRNMGTRKTAQGNGVYIAGVNSDFFNMTGSPTRTLSHSMVDGVYYNDGSGSAAWAKWASFVNVSGAKDVRILQNLTAGKYMIFPGGETYAYHVNGSRGDNFLVIYTDDNVSTGTNKWGRECTMKLISGDIKTNNAVFEITSEGVENVGDMAIPENGYVLSGIGRAQNLMRQLQPGDKVSLKPIIFHKDRETDFIQSVGGCSMLVIDGEVAPKEYFSANIVDHFTSPQARTAIGYNADRSRLILLVADKYSSLSKVNDSEKKTYGTSSGFKMETLGQVMHALGCYTAMACDGGGSSQLYNHTLGIRNVPYGDTGYLRPVANGFFAVSTSPVDEQINNIEVYQKNVKLAAGESFTPVVIGYNRYGVPVNKNVKGFSITVAPTLGTVSGTTFTAGNTAGVTRAVVTFGDIVCGVDITVNDGGTYVTSGNDTAPVMMPLPYTPDDPLGSDEEPNALNEVWHFVNQAYNDGWDKSAPDWSSSDAIKSQSCVRFATGYNGKFYTVDMKTMSIAEIDEHGTLSPIYKLPALTETINGTPDYYGTAISTDDAGNFLVGHRFTTPESFYVWTVYCPATGKAKHFVTDPGTIASRIDNIGRVVGDLTKDAYVYVAPKASDSSEMNKANIIHFTGDGNLDNVTATNELSSTIYITAAASNNTCTTIQPRYATVQEMTGKPINDTYIWYSKNLGIGSGSTFLMYRDNDIISDNLALGWENYSRLNGFDTFELGGKRYFAVAFTTADEIADNNSGQNICVLDTDGNKVGEWKNGDFKSANAGYNTITARIIDSSNADIYVYNCTGKFNGLTTGAIAGALLRFTVDTPAGIENVEIDTEEGHADPVYYNLQGVQVRNPGTGIYIVRRGNKVSKEYVR